VLLSRREPKAAYCFDQALALASGDWVIQWLAARIHFFYRQFARAIRFAQQALDLDATQAAVWLDLGRCQQALGLIGPARHSFTQARELDPACEGAGVGLIEVAQTGLIERWMGRLRELFNQGR
jgi:Flp pilus assembly protein TadD